MIKAEKRLFYNAFGLNILSDIPLPELPQISDGIKIEDILVELSDLTKVWAEMVINQQLKMIVKENFYMFKVRDTAIFCIQDGNKIVVSPNRYADFDKIRLFILGTCMGALLMQRKILPLHGSSIVIDGKAYAFVGERGAGKSTIAAAFIRNGYELLTDDVIAVELNGGVPSVIPSYPQQKLWQESLEGFGEDAKQFKPLYDREKKYSVPVKDNFYVTPVPLGGIVELVKTENDQIAINRIQGMDRLNKLYIHTFRQYLLNGFGLREWHFQTTMDLLIHIKMYQLQRPTSSFTAEQLVNLVLQTIEEGETLNARNIQTFIR